MFLDHFKMTAHPFSETTTVERILRDERISEGLARLEYLAHQGTIGLITGQTGVGKSSLIRLFFHSLSPTRHRPLYIHLTHLNSNALLRLIVIGMGEAPARGKERLFLQVLQRAQKSDLSTLIVVDEAHLLDSDSLIDLRLLASAGLENASPLKVVLCGQDTLRNQLKRECHADLVQRISVQVRLFPMTREQTASYIDFQMKKTGASEKIFEKEAKELIHDYASGIPRQINNVATACLINATARNLLKIDAELVNGTMSEINFP